MRKTGKISCDFNRRNREVLRPQQRPEERRRPAINRPTLPQRVDIANTTDVAVADDPNYVDSVQEREQVFDQSVQQIRTMQWHWRLVINDEVHIILVCTDDNKLPKHLTSLTAKYVDVRIRRIDDVAVPICSCLYDFARKNRIEAMDDITATHHVGTWIQDQCYHCKQVQQLYGPDQLFSNVSADVDVEESFPPTRLTCSDPKTPHLTGIYAGNLKTVGVIRTYKNAPPTCHSCGSTACDHITARKVHGPTEESDEEDEDEDLAEREEEDECEQYIFPTGPISHRNVLDAYRPLQSTDQCEHGGKLTEVFNRVISVFDCDGAQKKVMLYDLTSDCLAHCSHRLKYEDLGDLVFLNSSTACHRLLLLNYRCMLQSNANSLSGYHRYLVLTAKARQDNSTILSKSSLQRFWRLFLKHAVKRAEGFGCDECGPYPETLVFDGTRLGVKNTALSTYSSELTDEILPTVPYARRVLIRNRENRRQIRQYSENKLHYEGMRLAGLEPDVEEVLKISVGPDQMCLPHYKRILREFSVDGSIAASMQRCQETNLRRCWQSLIDGDDLWANPELLQIFMENQPTFFDCLDGLKRKGGIPNEVRKVLSRMLQVTDNTYSLPIPADSSFGPPTEFVQEFYPLWAKIRGDGKYDKDAIDATSCSDKLQEAHFALSPGVMVVACPHQGLYGFTLLQSGESPKHVMDIMLKRIPDERLPKMVYYDNGCKLLEYILSREAKRFSRTKIVIDDFHSNNHVGCSLELRAKHYKYNKEMNRTNSQCVEQLNRRIKRVKSFAQFLKTEEFMNTMVIYMSTV